jgi:hypothetical protein
VSASFKQGITIDTAGEAASSGVTRKAGRAFLTIRRILRAPKPEDVPLVAIENPNG